MTILAIDLGNYNIKTSEGFMFVSTFTEGEVLNPQGEEVLVFQDKTYMMEKGTFDNEYNKSKKNYKPNLLYAISKSIPKNIKEIDLVLGVPVDNIKITEQFKEELQGKEFEWILNGKKGAIKINRIATVGEGISAFYTLNKLKRLSPIIMVDIGGRTVNVIVFEKGKIKDKFTIPQGMIDLYDVIAAKENATGNRYRAEQIYDLIERNIITDTEKEEKLFIKQIMNEINRRVDINLYDIVFSGGGSIALENHLEELGDIIEDGLFANVNGNKLIAEKQWRG